MKVRKHIALLAEDELLAALQHAASKSGRKLGPEAAFNLRKVFRIGPFAKAKKECRK